MDNIKDKVKLSDIINSVSSYHYYVYDGDNIVSHHSNNMLNFDHVKKLKVNNTIIVVNLKPISKKENELNKTTQFKLIGGPLYGLITEYLVKEDNIYKLKSKPKNKVYFPKKYIVKIYKKNNMKQIKKDIMKIVTCYKEDKLKKQLFAINTITNIES